MATKEKYKVDKVVHEWSEKEDRWVYIEYSSYGKIIGLNFAQGDEYEYFKEKWCYNDQGLTEFYNTMLYTFPIERANCNTIEFINKVMWSYHQAIVSNEEHREIK